MFDEDVIKVLVVTILGVIIGLAINFLIVAGGLYLGLYVLHALGFMLSIVFSWKMAIAIWILLVIFKLLLKI